MPTTLRQNLIATVSREVENARDNDHNTDEDGQSDAREAAVRAGASLQPGAPVPVAAPGRRALLAAVGVR